MNEDTAATLLPEAPVETAADPWVGRVVDGRYRLLEKLGEGGMGAVFVAEHLKLQKLVALKTIHSTLEGHAEVTARFAREAMVSARIEHPNVVSSLDYGTLESGGAYLIMQLVRGEGLRARMEREGALPWRKACEIMEQIAEAVAAAHAAGIVHRDLKPENVVLEPSEGDGVHVKVLDFGIAHLRADTPQTQTIAPGAPLTQLGVVMGTPGYMAPEQAVGQPVDERTDVYALGVMLWELIAGFQPFQGNSLTEIVTQQFAEKPPALPPAAQAVPNALEALIAQMLSAKAEARPARAVEVRDQLRALREGKAGSASAALASAAILEHTRSGLHKVAQSPWFLAAQARFKALPGRVKVACAVGAAIAALLVWSALSADDTNAPPSAAASKITREKANATSARARPQGTAKRTKTAPARDEEGKAAAETNSGKRDEDGATSKDDTSSDGKASSERTKGESTKKATRQRPRDRIKRAVDSLFR